MAQWGQGMGDRILLLWLPRDSTFRLPAFRVRIFPSLLSPFLFFLRDRVLVSTYLRSAWNSGSPCLTLPRAGMPAVPLHADAQDFPLSLEDVPASSLFPQLPASNHNSIYTSAPWLWASHPMVYKSTLPSKQTGRAGGGNA